MSPRSSTLTSIGFDADDTLWQNEQFYRLTEERFAGLLSEHAEAGHISARLLEAEKRNLQHYGFGIKGFTLSMIETAIEVTEGRVPASVIQEILEAGREMLRHPVETLPHVARDARAARRHLPPHPDHQGRSLRSGAQARRSPGSAICSTRSRSSATRPCRTYERIFARHGDGPSGSMMVGNSLKSDVVPAIGAGSWGVYVPHALTWALEHAEAPVSEPRFKQLAHLGELIGLLRQIGP